MNESIRGIWYEAQRERYRVRLYKGDRMIHLSYHRTKSEALAEYYAVKNKAATTQHAYNLNTLEQQLQALSAGLL